MSLAWAELSIVAPAMLAGLLVLATHVPLGREVLARGIIFIDIAVAQLAALGVVAAHVSGLDPQGVALQLAAGGAALLGALVLHATERRWPEVQEAVIGSTFILAASAGLLLMAQQPHGGETFKDLLSGQILWVQPRHLIAAALVSAAALFLYVAPGRLPRLRFYLAFALAVTVSVQMVGVYLVFATLILPALAVRHRPGRRGLLLAYGQGVAAYAAGLAISLWLDLPAGPAIVWTLAAAAVVAGGLLPRRAGGGT